ncbi:hypothetical protein K440DRAFT_662037 [Wilcoxina mikolae CBS 423.85]|nr:hypothetical protein K440DRAFT_662037 [Wilcoxina mikolae CBS 423.85]
MIGFEIAGVVLAGPAVVAQLLKICCDGYRLFAGAKMAGKTIQGCQYEFNVTRVQLEGWIQTLSDHGGDVSLLIDQSSRRYQMVLETLALIAGVFSQVEQLERRYGVSRVGPEGPVNDAMAKQSSANVRVGKSRVIRAGEWCKAHLLPLPKASYGAASIPNHSRGNSNSSFFRRPPLSSTDLPLLPNDGDVTTKYSCETDLEIYVPGVGDYIQRMERTADEYQRTLTTFRQYAWEFSSREDLQLLIQDLKRYTTTLESLTHVAFKAQTIVKYSATFNEFQVPVELPFSRLKKFSGREDHLATIKNSLEPVLSETNGSSGQIVILLHGMGGMGKSQIALEYAYRHTRDYNSIFWIDATDQGTITSSGVRVLETLIAHYAKKYSGSPDFGRIATDLGIPGRVDSGGKLVDEATKLAWRSVRSWLAREGSSQWCFIADGLNDDVELHEILPACNHGHIIITSRVRVHGCDLVVDIGEMDKDSALKLLVVNEKLEDLADEARTAAEMIVEKLGNLPLAVSQAAAYMARTVLSFVEYLERLCEDITRFIGRPFPLYADGVFSCWKLSVQALKESNPDAIHLLRLCAFLSPDGIPKELLYRGLEAMDWVENDKFRLDEAIGDLIKYALMKHKFSSTGGSQSLWMHPLVQLWARDSYDNGKSVVLERESDFQLQLRKEGAREAVCLVGRALRVETNTRQNCEWLFEREISTHLKLCYDEYISKYIWDDDDLAGEKLALMLCNFGMLKFYWDESYVAADFLRKALRLYEKLPHRSLTTEIAFLHAKQGLAAIYLCGGINRRDYCIENVALLLDETFLGQRLLLGEYHRETLVSLDLKGTCLHKQGKSHESLKLRQICLDSTKKALPENDPASFVANSNIAPLYTSLGQYDLALQYYMNCLDLCERFDDLNRRNSVVTMSNIAIFFEHHLKDYEKALEYWQKSAEGYESILGLANRRTLEALEKLKHVCLLKYRANSTTTSTPILNMNRTFTIMHTIAQL